jgi:hypothetical protein
MRRPRIRPRTAPRPPAAALAAALAGLGLVAAVLAAPADARLGPLPPGPALHRDLVPDEPEIRIRVGTDKWGREEIRGGHRAPVMTDDGVLFRLRARGARDVAVAGNFNDWMPEPMDRHRGGRWRLPVELGSGSWRYAFVVDGQWITDPDNPVTATVAEPVGDGLDEVSILVVRHGEVVSPLPPGTREVAFGVRAAYDRVDQFSAYGTLRYSNRPRLHPELTLLGGYSFGRDRGLYDIGLTQPFFAPRLLDLGVTAFRRTDTRDRHRIGDTENSLAAFFGRQDWRDWFEAEGVSAFGRVYLGRHTSVSGTWTREDHRTVEKTTDWGLFWPKRDMRDNPAADEGTYRSARVALEHDSRNNEDNPTRGGQLHASWEWVGGELGGAAEFQRGLADVRRYVTVSPGYWIDVRLAGGTIRRASRGEGTDLVEGFFAIPVQERFYLGGIGTMRATRFKSLTGDRMFLGNAEMRVEIFDNVQVAVFADVGDAWVEADRDIDVKVDGGIGLQDADANLRLNLAKKLDGRDGAVIFSGRLQRMF